MSNAPKLETQAYAKKPEAQATDAPKPDTADEPAPAAQGDAVQQEEAQADNAQGEHAKIDAQGRKVFPGERPVSPAHEPAPVQAQSIPV